MLPLIDVMLDPIESTMFRAVVNEIAPVPFAASLLVEFGRLIAPVALTDRFLSALSVSPPANVTELNGLAAEPRVKLELKSVLERLLTVRISAELPRLIVSDPVGFWNTVVSKLPLPLRNCSMP